MSEFLPIKSIYTGADVTALGEAAPDDVMLAPDGGIKYPDGSVQLTAKEKVSVDAGNTAIIGSDGFIFVPSLELQDLTDRVISLEQEIEKLLPWCWLEPRSSRASALDDLTARVAALEAAMAELLPWTKL